MPYVWKAPELFYKYKGKKIYHTYHDDNCLSDFWYTTEPHDDDIDGSDEFHFDIRDIESDLVKLFHRSDGESEKKLFKSKDVVSKNQYIMKTAIMLNLIRFPNENI